MKRIAVLIAVMSAIAVTVGVVLSQTASTPSSPAVANVTWSGSHFEAALTLDRGRYYGPNDIKWFGNAEPANVPAGYACDRSSKQRILSLREPEANRLPNGMVLGRAVVTGWRTWRSGLYGRPTGTRDSYQYSWDIGCYHSQVNTGRRAEYAITITLTGELPAECRAHGHCHEPHPAPPAHTHEHSHPADHVHDAENRPMTLSDLEDIICHSGSDLGRPGHSYGPVVCPTASPTATATATPTPE